LQGLRDSGERYDELIALRSSRALVSQPAYDYSVWVTMEFGVRIFGWQATGLAIHSVCEVVKVASLSDGPSPHRLLRMRHKEPLRLVTCCMSVFKFRVIFLRREETGNRKEERGKRIN
jgi:hypothetical protein